MSYRYSGYPYDGYHNPYGGYNNGSRSNLVTILVLFILLIIVGIILF